MENPFKKPTIEDLQNDKQKIEKLISQMLLELHEKYPEFISYIETEHSNVDLRCGRKHNFISVKIKLESI